MVAQGLSLGVFPPQTPTEGLQPKEKVKQKLHNLRPGGCGFEHSLVLWKPLPPCWATVFGALDLGRPMIIPRSNTGGL